MSKFDVEMTAHQIGWRAKQGHDPELGWQNGRQYEHLLPRSAWKKSLWPPIAEGLASHLESAKIQAHSGTHNLKSSWVLCANLYYPFGLDSAGRGLLADFLRAYLDPSIETVDEVHLEYAEAGKLSPATLLGELGGSRGTGQTSPDLGIIANCGRALLLIENKFTEHSYYACSARNVRAGSSRSPNPDITRCHRPAALIDGHADLCHQASWGRHYWYILGPIADREKIAELSCCPAALAGYQLFRQQALAEGIAQYGEYDLVVSAVAFDDRNVGLARSLRSTGLDDLSSWGELFHGKARFGCFTHQKWVDWVRTHDAEGLWTDWLAYVCARYQFG